MDNTPLLRGTPPDKAQSRDDVYREVLTYTRSGRRIPDELCDLADSLGITIPILEVNPLVRELGWKQLIQECSFSDLDSDADDH